MVGDLCLEYNSLRAESCGDVTVGGDLRLEGNRFKDVDWPRFPNVEGTVHK